MKHLTILSLCTLHFSLFTHSAALPEKWEVDLAAQPPQVFTLQRPRGETYDLEAVLKNHGKPFAPAITNAFIFWQTNGMENLYWSAPASVSTNTVPAASSPRGVAETNYVLRASWLPSMDPGATTVRGYIGDPGHIYAAAFQFRFIASPGATPNELPLPQKVIDFAKVTVLNPPWSGGGGGGVDTNAVIDIIHRTVDGSARPLPPYLHYLEMDDTYPDAAAEWYAQADYSHGSCSARRAGNVLERNYDWNFDFMPEFVVRISSRGGDIPVAGKRFASLAVCNVGTNLTEEMVNSGKWSKWYKALPGHAVDGINENGVVAEVNVCPTNGVEGWTGTEVHCLGGVRYALDHATNAAHAASLLAEKVYVPQGYGNFHYMVADERETWIVENGEAHLVTGATGVPPVAVMTNFRLYPTRDTSGEGQERYDALVSGANITSQWWTLTYTANGYRASDLPGITGEDLANLFNYWENNPRESHRGERFGDKVWWQSIHTSIYDITNRTLKIAVQETDDWYVFQVPSAGGGGVKPETVKEIVEPMIGAATNGIPEQIASLQSGKRDLTNDVCYVLSFTYPDYSATGVDFDYRVSGATAEEVASWGLGLTWQKESEDGVEKDGWYSINGMILRSEDRNLMRIEYEAEWDDYDEVSHRAHVIATRKVSEDLSHVLARRATTAASALAKFDADGNLVAAGASDIPHDATKLDSAGGEAEDLRAEGLFVSRAAEFEVEYLVVYGDVELEYDLSVDGSTEFFGGDNYFDRGARFGDDVRFYTRPYIQSNSETNKHFFATTNDIVDAVSTNNPAFVSAVQSVSPPPSPNIRLYDEIRQCWWIGKMVNGVLDWTVED